ncbi:uncharacterized protein FMAN_07966 [Fusarium mangiferae]|uniref:Uncharacterized protein n=1 Tax=Fusarium mangiferae TaxID=192010 RepID=A0A1L7TT64_FUSMA|nr:uncharacterized protein FMAN_07966 [Fusarium mangiferae]CVL01804.1 uncharacterized protein FMAN_07966 [Fusarium mangiferae]
MTTLQSAASSSDEVEEVLPVFVSAISSPSPLIYFHHVIDPETTKLTVQVLGANISFVFSHRRAKTVIGRSRIEAQLENKTTGFTSIVSATSQRVVLAAAESGHGLGKYGDVLDKKRGILPNSIWTRRVVSMGKTLGLNMRRPFDNPGRRVGNTEGIFLGSHVEVKLAVHGICVLLQTFEITKDFNNVTMKQLNQLRRARWEDGSRPVLEVYFSRKYCKPCKSLVQKLQDATGVTIRLVWKPRLVMKKYILRPIDRNRKPGEPLGAQEFEPQDYDFGDILPDDSDIEVISDDEGAKEEVDKIDLTHIRSTSPISWNQEIDDYLDGLAYRVGQMKDCPEGARSAIVEFASIRVNAKKSLDAAKVSKPLPATPVIEAPADFLEGDNRQRQRHTFPRAQKRLFREPHDKNGSRARSVSPKRRAQSVRDRSPRRYNSGPLGRHSTEAPQGRSTANATSRSRSTR